MELISPICYSCISSSSSCLIHIILQMIWQSGLRGCTGEEGSRRQEKYCSAFQLFSNYFSGSGEDAQRLMKDRQILGVLREPRRSTRSAPLAAASWEICRSKLDGGPLRILPTTKHLNMFFLKMDFCQRSSLQERNVALAGPSRLLSRRPASRSCLLAAQMTQ